MVEEDPVAGEHAVRLPVVDRHPVGVDLGGAVRGARIEGRPLSLRRRGGAEHLAGGGLVVAGRAARAAQRLEDAGRAQAGDVAGVFGDVEGDAHVALRAQVVDFVGLDVVDEVGELPPVRQVAVVQEHAGAGGVRVDVDVVEAAGVEGGGAADDAVDLVPLREEELDQVRSVLAGDAGDECLGHAGVPWRAVLAALARSRKCIPKRGESSMTGRLRAPQKSIVSPFPG